MSVIMLHPQDVARIVADVLGERVTGVECTIDKLMHITLKGFDVEKSMLGLRAPRFDVRIAATAKIATQYSVEFSYDVVAPRLLISLIDLDSVLYAIRSPFVQFRPIGPRHFLIHLNNYRVEEFRIPSDPHALEVRFSSDAA